MSHRIIWFDLPVIDLQRAVKFYSAVLDVEITEMAPDVAVISHEENEVSGCLYVKEGDRPSDHGVLLYMNVDGRLEYAVHATEAHGGQVLRSIHQIGEWGNRAIILDTEGNRIALHSS